MYKIFYTIQNNFNFTPNFKPAPDHFNHFHTQRQLHVAYTSRPKYFTQLTIPEIFQFLLASKPFSNSLLPTSLTRALHKRPYPVYIISSSPNNWKLCVSQINSPGTAHSSKRSLSLPGKPRSDPSIVTRPRNVKIGIQVGATSFRRERERESVGEIMLRNTRSTGQLQR